MNESEKIYIMFIKSDISITKPTAFALPFQVFPETRGHSRGDKGAFAP